MVGTPSTGADADERAVATDETFAEAPHRHRPVAYSDPYVEFGAWWAIPICECGISLTPRRASAAKRPA